MKKVSVVVPVYNVGSLVRKCVDTIVNQSYKEIEVIIVNDGSTDDSKLFIDYYGHDNIKSINLSKNLGLGNARNIGIANSTGNYLAFVDSDDWIDLDLYAEMINSIEKYDADIAICGIKNEYSNYISSEFRYNYIHGNTIDSEMAIKLLSNYSNNNCRISPVVWNKLYRTDFIKSNKIEFLNNSYWEDDVFTFQAFIYAKTVTITPDVYYHYFQRDSSITNDFSKKHIDDLIYSFLFLKNYLIKQSLWNMYQNYFNSYMDRAITSLFNMLFKREPSVIKQKEYLLEFYHLFSEKFSVSEAIEYMDISRIRRLFI